MKAKRDMEEENWNAAAAAMRNPKPSEGAIEKGVQRGAYKE